MSEADKRQEGGTHYKNRPIQTWNLIIPMGWSAFQFEIINYVDRYQRKGGIEDLKKARHWLDKLIEVEEARLAPKEEFKLSEGDAGPRISFEGVADGYAVCEGDLYRVSWEGGNVVMRQVETGERLSPWAEVQPSPEVQEAIQIFNDGLEKHDRLVRESIDAATCKAVAAHQFEAGQTFANLSGVPTHSQVEQAVQLFNQQVERKTNEKILEKIEQEAVSKRRAVEDEKGAIATVKAQMAASPAPPRYTPTDEEG